VVTFLSSGIATSINTSEPFFIITDYNFRLLLLLLLLCFSRIHSSLCDLLRVRFYPTKQFCFIFLPKPS
jgi:hypothetical protein